MSPFMTRVYHLVHVAQTWQGAALSVVQAAGRALDKDDSPADRQALALLNRVFNVSVAAQSTRDAIEDVARIERVFIEMRHFLAAVRSGKPYLIEALSGAPGVLAYVKNVGAWAKRDPSDGIWFVRPMLERSSNESIVDAMIHEAAHFVGPVDQRRIGHALIKSEVFENGAGSGIPAPASLGAANAAYGDAALTMSNADALVNASSYAWLAYLARKPRAAWTR